MEFIGGKEYKHENSMKAALVKQMKKFILELGKDFLFYDEEFRLQVGNSDFRIDLLFYHRELQCLVAFELLCCAQHNKSYVAQPIMLASNPNSLCA